MSQHLSAKTTGKHFRKRANSRDKYQQLNPHNLSSPEVSRALYSTLRHGNPFPGDASRYRSIEDDREDPVS